MSCSLSILTGGCNATGLSAMFSIERELHSPSDSVVLDRCLINAGDTVQRFCSENRIKLSRVSCLIITSLAPHNVSGLPGLVLCLSSLGVGLLTIIGPPGLKGLIYSMAVFTNRKYPELDIYEVGAPISADYQCPIQIDLEYLRIFVKPVFVSKAQHESSAIAIAAVVLQTKPTMSMHSTNPTESQNLPKGLMVMPFEREGRGMFRIKPSMKSLMYWANATVSSAYTPQNTQSYHTLNLAPKGFSVPLVLFFPISVACLGIPATVKGSFIPPSALLKTNSNIRKCCEKFRITGILFDATLNNYACELRQAQETLTVLGTFCKPLFPVPLRGLKREICKMKESRKELVIGADVSGTHSSVKESEETGEDDTMQQSMPSNSTSDHCTVVKEVQHSIFRSSALYPAVPLMRIPLSPASDCFKSAMFIGECFHMEVLGDSDSSDDGDNDDSDSDSEEYSTETESESSSEEDESESDVDDTPPVHCPPPTSCYLDSAKNINSTNINNNNNNNSSSRTDNNSKSITYSSNNITTTKKGSSSKKAKPPREERYLRCTTRYNPLTGIATRILDKIELIKSFGSHSPVFSRYDGTQSAVPHTVARDVTSIVSSVAALADGDRDVKGERVEVKKRGSLIDQLRVESTLFSSSSSSSSSALMSESSDGSHSDRVENGVEEGGSTSSVRAGDRTGVTIPDVCFNGNHINLFINKRTNNNNSIIDGGDNSVSVISGTTNHSSTDISAPLARNDSNSRDSTITSQSSSDVLGNISAAAGLRLMLSQRNRKRPLPPTDSTDVPTRPQCHDEGIPADSGISPLSNSITANQFVDEESLVQDPLPPVLHKLVIPVIPVIPIIPVIPLIPVIPPPSPHDVTVTFLGTGSATPSKHRNNSCIMISIPIPIQVPIPAKVPAPESRPKTSAVCTAREESTVHTVRVPPSCVSRGAHIILLDAGEGTCVQLYQSVGGDVDRFNAALLSIRLVWISHHHADHICGLPMLLEHVNRALLLRKLQCRKGSNNNYNSSGNWDGDGNKGGSSQGIAFSKIIVIAPPVVLKYYEYCACISGLDDLVQFVPVSATLFASYSVPLPAVSGVKIMLRSVQVPHCKESYAAVLDIQRDCDAGVIGGDRGRGSVRVVYSGDCRPSSALITAGRHCDLLLHEATFDDTMQSDAECKRHCTTSEAVAVGVRMMAKHIVLTHFSQRYPTTVQSFSVNPSPCSVTVDSNVNSTSGPSDKQNLDRGKDKFTDKNKNRNRERARERDRERDRDGGSKFVEDVMRDAVNLSDKPYSVAFDLLHFSFPSQVHSLPSATGALARCMAAASAAARETD